MDAKEYLTEQGYLIHEDVSATAIRIFEVEKLLESYHTHRTQQEAQEMYSKAMMYFKRNYGVVAGKLLKVLINTIKVASGLTDK